MKTKRESKAARHIARRLRAALIALMVLGFLASPVLSGEVGTTSEAAASPEATLRANVQEALLGLGVTSFEDEPPVAIGGLLYFAATDGVNGVELWRSDGTQAGTVMVKDIRPGADSSFPRSLVNVNGVLFFTADTGATAPGTGRELWRSNGTANGTVLVRDIQPGTGSSNPTHLTVLNGVLFFAADDGVHGNELWKSKGTRTTTVLVSDLNITPAPSASSDPRDLTPIGNTLYFSADNGINGREPWKSGGFRSGTVMVRDIAEGPGSSDPNNFTELNGIAVFTADDTAGTQAQKFGRELWKTNGLRSGTAIVRDIFEGPTSSNPAFLTRVGNRVFFSADDGVHGNELWISDGLPKGVTRLVADISPGVASSDPEELVSFEGSLIFSAVDGTVDPFHGRELWKSDGTEESTTILEDIRPGVGSSSPHKFKVVENALFFVADDGTRGNELWMTNGVAGGTALVKDINSEIPGANSNPGQVTSDPPNPPDPTQRFLAVVEGRLFFTAQDGVNGIQLWTSNGKPAGTVRTTETVAGPNSSNPQKLTDNRGTLFFTADDGNRGRELWKSNGNRLTTGLPKDIYRLKPSSDPNALVSADGTVYFSAFTPLQGRELWKSRGTSTDTVLVRDIVPGKQDSFPDNLTAVGSRVFFTANDLIHGNELWVTAGTEALTTMVKDIFPGEGSSSPRQLIAFQGLLFFVAEDGVNGRELWRSDGTDAGTFLVKDIFPGPGSSFPTELTVVGNTLFFVARNLENGNELWKTDGTEEGTVLVRDIHRGLGNSSNPAHLTDVGGVLFFSASDGNDSSATPAQHGTELWRSDGTEGGTFLVKDINQVRDNLTCGGECSSSPRSLVNVNGILYFSATDGDDPTALNPPQHGRELWRSDGTEAGTFMIRDIREGAESSDPDLLTAFNDLVVFVADDGPGPAAAGRELWRSDGTKLGTKLQSDIRPGPDSSKPEDLVVSGGILYFSADDGTTGRELWKIQRFEGQGIKTVLVRDIRP